MKYTTLKINGVWGVAQGGNSTHWIVEDEKTEQSAIERAGLMNEGWIPEYFEMQSVCRPAPGSGKEE